MNELYQFDTWIFWRDGRAVNLENAKQIRVMKTPRKEGDGYGVSIDFDNDFTIWLPSGFETKDEANKWLYQTVTGLNGRVARIKDVSEHG